MIKTVTEGISMECYLGYLFEKYILHNAFENLTVCANKWDLKEHFDSICPMERLFAFSQRKFKSITSIQIKISIIVSNQVISTLLS